jgi:hypothetical protein
VIEGYLQNGTFGYRSLRGYDYDASYVSHSHGWSSGPTSGLTTYVLGLSVTGIGGTEWKLAPQFRDLTSAEGGFTTILGKYQASWQLAGSGYKLSYNVPEGTTGQPFLPCLAGGKWPSIQIDGQPVPRALNPQIVGNGVVLTADGGEHVIEVR